ncbi:MAG TPA: T9SS type A sorting domain-containing protein, partial [Bacteroidetes bacterium]|nr:T9SS type A sorting domain-containing protein [Bacteroidota bacterium]
QWLSVDPTTGTLGQDEYTDVDVMLDATNLDPAHAYKAKLIVRNNDPDNSSVTINVEADVIVGIDENGNQVKEYVVAYPNPAKDFLRVTTNGNIQHIRILNSVGQMVFDSPMNNSDAQINTSRFDSGIYFLQVETKNGISTQKFIIE